MIVAILFGGFNLADLVFLVYSLVVLVYGWWLIDSSLALGQIAPATEWPVAVVGEQRNRGNGQDVQFGFCRSPVEYSAAGTAVVSTRFRG